MLNTELNQPHENQRHFTIALLILILFTLLSSCNKFQYGTISATLPSNEQHEYIDENELYKISYSFMGEHCPLQLTIKNKHNIPLYVDWYHSYVLIDTTPMPLKEPYIPSNLATYNYGQSDTTMWHNSPGVTVLPPDTYTNFTPFNMSSEWLEKVETEIPKREKFKTTYGTSSANCYYYSKNNSPLYFKTVLAIAYDKCFDHVIYKESDFWIDKLMYTFTNPDDVNQQKNWFYDTEITEFGRLAYGIATLSILGGMILLVAIENTDEADYEDY